MKNIGETLLFPTLFALLGSILKLRGFLCHFSFAQSTYSYVVTAISFILTMLLSFSNTLLGLLHCLKARVQRL